MTTDLDRSTVAMMPRPTVDDARIALGIDAERRAFLDAAFARHLGPEMRRDLAGVVASYAHGGGLVFNGARYDTPESLLHFHREMGFDGRGTLANLGAVIANLHYTQDSVIVEYEMWGDVVVELRGAPPGRHVRFPACGVYQFDEAGLLVSERIYLDTGNWLPEPVFRPAL
jgi:hypothetical protein